MNKSISLFLILLASAVVTGNVAQAAEINVGVVNVARLLDESPQAKSAMKALADEFAPRQRDLQSQEQEIREKEEELKRNAAVMAENERRDAERGLRDKARDFSRKQQEYLEDLNLRRNEELGRLQRALMEEVQAFARQQKYDLIVGDGVLFASPSVDVTAQVLAGLERSFQASSN